MLLSNLYLSLGQHRDKTGESRGRIGLRAGITESRLCTIVHCKVKATSEERAALARILEADEEYLFAQKKN